jgi:hypothetical protein
MSNSYWVDTFNLDPAHPQASLTSSKTQQERLGIPPGFTSVVRHAHGQSDFTGSRYGFNAIMFAGTGSDQYGISDYIELSEGGRIQLRDFGNLNQVSSSNVFGSGILDLSLRQISSSAGTPIIYAFKRKP